MKQYLIIAGIALGVSLVVGFTFFNHSSTTVVHEDGTTTTVGAATGPDNFFPVETHNGVTSYFFKGALISSTTAFVIKSPGATTTIQTLNCATTNSTTTGQTFNLTKGTGMQSSTTALSNNITVAAGAQGVVSASTTMVDTVRTINPNTFIQFNSFGGVGLSNLTGSCSIVLTGF